jgi:hypothetical protein
MATTEVAGQPVAGWECLYRNDSPIDTTVSRVSSMRRPNSLASYAILGSWIAAAVATVLAWSAAMREGFVCAQIRDSNGAFVRDMCGSAPTPRAWASIAAPSLLAAVYTWYVFHRAAKSRSREAAI